MFDFNKKRNNKVILWIIVGILVLIAAAALAAALGFSFSTTPASVVMNREAIEVALVTALLVTLVGSTIPAGIMSTYSSL